MNTFGSPLHVHADVSVAYVMSRIHTLPDDFQIPPADGVHSAQVHGQCVLELDVGFVHLKRKKKENHKTQDLIMLKTQTSHLKRGGPSMWKIGQLL